MILPRSRLLARLVASEPRLVTLCAPAGYGKSTVARLYAKRFDRHAICDCDGVTNAAEFAARAMSALAEESQDSDDSLAATRLRLHATEADSASWGRALLDVWKTRHERGLFVLENAEAVSDNRGVLALVGDMLAARPMERVLLIASSTPLPLRTPNYLAPHQSLTLLRDDLRLEHDEACGIFERIDLAPEIVERIVQLADGWPIVLLLLARFADYEPNVEQLLEELANVEFPNLHEHLSRSVLNSLPTDMMKTLLAAAAIPQASLDDISAATGIRHAAPIIEGLLRLPGFVSASQGSRYQTHSLVLSDLRERHPREFAQYLTRTAGANEAAGDYLRAAELYACAGNTEAAAAALNALAATALESPSSRLIDALTRIDMATLCKFPSLWIAALPYRTQQVDEMRLYDEASALLAALRPNASPALRRRLRIRLAILAQGLGKLGDAKKLLESLGPAGNFDDAPEERRLVLMTLAVIAAKTGRLSDADRLIEEADAVQSARHVRFDTERSRVGMERARMLGEWHDLLRLREEALAAAQRSGVTARIIKAAREVCRAAWYCNDDARATAARQMLIDCGDPGVRLLERCVQGALAGEEVEAPPRVLRIASFKAAFQTTDIETAEDLFDRAIAGIDCGENGFLRILVRVGAALLLPSQRRRLIEAREIAQTIESPPLQASLELLIDTPEPADAGIFQHLAARAATSPLRVGRYALCVDVIKGQVRRGGDVVHVSDRGLELLVALALLPPGSSREELAAAIWPSLDAEASLNALKMCVHRTRTQLADKDAILSTKRGYSLSEHVQIDILEVEHLLRSVRGVDALGESVRRQIQETIRTLAAHKRLYAAEWAWFAPHAAHLADLHHELTFVLAKDAFRRDDPATVYELAERLIKLDRRDEAAYVLKIEALLKHGDRVSAMREYRRYRSALDHDANPTQSEHLATLMGVN